jgi:3-oxoacyl-[acyl-carrier protein] reductase
LVVNFNRSEEAARATARDAEAAGARTLLFRCDVSDDTCVRAMLDATKREFKRLDVLINNAGTTIDVEPKEFDKVKVDEWNRVFAVNVLGLFLVTRAATPLLRESPNGCVVNTCSIAGLRPGPQPLPYAASKAAVANLTKTLAVALGPKVRVNAVAPGWMEGDWMQRRLGENYEGLMARRARYTPLKRCVTADEVAETMLSLIVSNRFVTGEIIIVDGGFSSTS